MAPFQSMLSKKQFHEVIYSYYREHRRDLPWRRSVTPYKVVVSEIMLQQTQVDRVAPKYKAFIKRFPNWQTLARASTADVLTYWQGLGYNRRALALQRMAQMVMRDHAGRLPHDPEILEQFPGIGPHTAASICAFAFDLPVVFIETNIRSVFIHHFFTDRIDVTDAELQPLIAKMLDTNCPRQWYSALMDYGTMLKKQVGNPSQRSKHYTKQSKFEGSRRQLRGRVLKLLLDRKDGLSLATIQRELMGDAALTKAVLGELQNENFIAKKGVLWIIRV